MARITVEDCLQNEPNLFNLVLLAAKRARRLANGAEATLEWENDKPTVVALREIAEQYVLFRKGRQNKAVLHERVELTRDLHENAIQRLFGVALALGSEDDLTKTERRALPGGAALGRRRPAPRADPAAGDPGARQQGLPRRAARTPGRAPPRAGVDWADGVEVPLDFEPVAQLVLNEALRNVDRHAQPDRDRRPHRLRRRDLQPLDRERRRRRRPQHPRQRPRPAARRPRGAPLRGPGRVRLPRRATAGASASSSRWGIE